LDFPQNQWRGSSLPTDMLKDMQEAGTHPFDIFETDGEAASGESDSKPATEAR
jgi:hypothetical protein